MDNIYSSKQVAELIGVNESTVKRWADSGTIKCFKTPGGHRKFRKEDVSEFASKFSFGTAGKMLKVFSGAAEPDNGNIKNLLLKKLFSGSDNDVFEFLNAQLGAGMSLVNLYDNVVSSAMTEIGVLWASGKIGIDMEHIASAKLTKAVIRINSLYASENKTGLHAVCAALENEYHELPVLLSAGILQHNGWNVIYTGANTPHTSLISAINRSNPDLVCISSTVINDKDEFKRALMDIRLAAEVSEALLAIGGAAAEKIVNASEYADFIAGSLYELVKFTKDNFGV